MIAALRRDSRIPLTTLARQLHIDVDHINNILKEERNNTLLGFSSLINYEQLGFPIRVMMILAVRSKEKEDILKYLRKMSALNGLFFINNSYDFFVDLIFRDMRQTQEFIERLESNFTLYEHKEYYILSTLTEQHFMTNPDLLPC